METQRSSSQSEADRLSQEHSFKIRDLQKKQREELQMLADKHQRDMSTMDQAYTVELTSKKDEFERKLGDINESQASRLAQVSTNGELSVKQAQETYRLQAEELNSKGEKKLNTIRESQVNAEEGILRKSRKGSA